MTAAEWNAAYPDGAEVNVIHGAIVARTHTCGQAQTLASGIDVVPVLADVPVFAHLHVAIAVVTLSSVRAITKAQP